MYHPSTFRLLNVDGPVDDDERKPTSRSRSERQMKELPKHKYPGRRATLIEEHSRNQTHLVSDLDVAVKPILDAVTGSSGADR